VLGLVCGVVKLFHIEFRVYFNGAEECVMDSLEGQGFRGVDESSGECFSG